MENLTAILQRIEQCIVQGTYESLETDWLEIKSVPATGGAWDSIRESVGAFLNARGGTVVLGIKDEQKTQRRFILTGYTEDNSGNVANLRTAFQDFRRNPIDVSDCLLLEVLPFQNRQIAVIRVSALPEDRKFCFYHGEAYERVLDQDKRIPQNRVEDQEERKREMEHFRELRPVDGATLADLSLQRINELIFLINQGQSHTIESIKSRIEEAIPFLERKRFMLKNGSITTLGMLVCGAAPEEHLGFRCHLDAFVDVPNVIAQDKKTWRDNILQLMEAGQGWTLRNILTGVSTHAGGSLLPEYPEKLIRESINNALAHRDYSLDRPVQLTLKPRVSLSIRNPGRIPHELIFEKPDDPVPVRRIFANPRARNPRLADVLKLHNKWEGKGIGMSDLLNFALGNSIDLPYYLFHSADELSLCIPSGKLLDEAMEAWLDLMDGLIASKTGDRALSGEHRIVLAYLLKSERLNRIGRYTLALTPSNNHFGAISELKAWGLALLHPSSNQFHEVYVVCRELAEDDRHSTLRELFGSDYDRLDILGRETLQMIALAASHSKAGGLNAKQVSRLLKTRLPDEYQQRGDDEFYRAIRYRIERNAPAKRTLDLSSPDWHAVPDRMLSIRGPSNRPTFRLNSSYLQSML